MLSRFAKPSVSMSKSISLHFLDAARAMATEIKATGPRLDEHGEPRFLEQVKLHFNNAAAKTGIDPQYLALIQACKAVVRFNIPLRMDDGSLRTVTCYR